eukprot:scaffold1054_cov333-Pavlova_lutheri.AAC.6
MPGDAEQGRPGLPLSGLGERQDRHTGLTDAWDFNSTYTNAPNSLTGGTSIHFCCILPQLSEQCLYVAGSDQHQHDINLFNLEVRGVIVTAKKHLDIIGVQQPRVLLHNQLDDSHGHIFQVPLGCCCYRQQGPSHLLEQHRLHGRVI